ncbi:hypothetical protein GC163_11050 [bacterium]|nr:hypothetical protein [bacterium]
MAYRVGVVTLIQESNTFLSEATTLAHFQQDVLITGEEVRLQFATALHEVGGFFQGLQDPSIETVPLFAARAYPFGTMTGDTFQSLVERLQQQIARAGQLDGLLVAPHGATVAASHPDADGYWLSLVRQAVGPTIPIIGTLDSHANLSPAMVAATDALMGYRSNPHIDQLERGKEAAHLMIRTVRGEVRPMQAACFLPMAINIERQCTSEQPLSNFNERLDAARTRPGVLAISLLLGFPYADVPEMGSSLLVVTDNNPELAQSIANELGDELWVMREGLAGNFISVSDAVTQAVSLRGPVCLLDMGDNVGGGSPADGTLLAWELHRRGIGPSLVILNDPESVHQAEHAGIGARLSMSLGGKTDDRHGAPLTAEFTVMRISHGAFTESEVRHGGITRFDQGRTAIVISDNGLTVMLTSRRAPPFSLKQLTTFGLTPQEYRVIVAKGVNAPLAAYKPVCPNIIRVNTPGVTTADMRQLAYTQRRQPMWPFEPETTWAP